MNRRIISFIWLYYINLISRITCQNIIFQIWNKLGQKYFYHWISFVLHLIKSLVENTLQRSSVRMRHRFRRYYSIYHKKNIVKFISDRYFTYLYHFNRTSFANECRNPNPTSTVTLPRSLLNPSSLVIHTKHVKFIHTMRHLEVPREFFFGSFKWVFSQEINSRRKCYCKQKVELAGYNICISMCSNNSFVQ